MTLSRRRLRRSLFTLRLLFSAAVVLVLLYTTLAYDNPIRLSLQFNTQRAGRFITGPLRNDRWLYERPRFPLDWATDVAIILKTGYGTQERALAWLQALPTGISLDSVLVVGDFASEMTVRHDPPVGLRIHDVVSGALQSRDSMMGKEEDMHPARAEKYRLLAAAIAAGEDALARNLSGTFGWELDAMKFIPALDLAYRTMPHKKWFIMVDDDTYLIQPSLNLVLGHFDPATPYYLGNAVGDYRQRFAHGGSSIALSHAALQALFSQANSHRTAEARRASLTETWGDRLLARTLQGVVGIRIDEASSRFFNGEQPWASRLRADRFCVPVASFHRLSAEEMGDVGRVFRVVADPVLWVDLWELYGAPPFASFETRPLRQGWDHVGRLDEHTTTVEGVTAAAGCSRLCEGRRGCLAWTWQEEDGLCHMSPWITVGSEVQGRVSGLHVGRVRRFSNECR
ncbi:hypothetical protein M406DRAFT_248906 [Cryphonectria parasitica EP155]|uniref:N-acetylgalactosaminide beta-1,3-galactosyltransferase n=1 Tax=Cryphonectria parasitica (strain ATCC 38755 / EP155) TaxID=660469 RepID=A0A9P4YCC8_CRYP1|nr:uncharacterized protein M406DRAFT_248906 [Cryphonectria parasitica EP155]KAF3770483.1 hypothetical protein M406DRAFT_248906 [Cryphonectria parasitica EP155]